MEPSSGLQRGVDGLEQSGVTERFKQKPRRAQLEYSSTNRFISLTSNEYDRDAMPAALELLVEFRSTHVWHRDVEEQATGLIDAP